MPAVMLPHGPWNSLLYGKYEGKDVSIYQNPNRDILYVVVDKGKDGKPKGLVVTVYRGFYLERGSIKELVGHLSGFPVGMAKKWKGETFSFLLLPAGIKYIGLDPKELRDTVNEMVSTLNRMEKNVLVLANTLGFILKPLSLVPRNVAALLFIEPVFIAGLAPVAGSGTSAEAVKEGLVVLGRDTKGGIARDSLVNFRRTLIYGDPVGRKRTFAVIMEEFLRNGVNILLVTSDASRYRGITSAGAGGEELSSLELKPIGFSMEELQPSIDLATVPPDALIEITGVKKDTETAKKLRSVLVEHGVEATRPADLLEKVEGNDMISLRVGRILQALDLVEGDRFQRLTYNTFLSLSTTGLGGVFVLEVKDPWSHLSLVSYVSGIGKALERRGKTENVRIALFVEDAERVFTREENPVTTSLLKLVEHYRDYGLGWVLEVEKDVKLNDMILALTETRIGAISEKDVGVRTLTRSPYRLYLRPFLSSIELSPAPAASSPPAPQPGRR